MKTQHWTSCKQKSLTQFVVDMRQFDRIYLIIKQLLCCQSVKMCEMLKRCSYGSYGTDNQERFQNGVKFLQKPKTHREKMASVDKTVEDLVKY